MRRTPMRARLLCAWAAFALASACAHAPPPPLESTKLVVDRTHGMVRPFLRATVAGHPINLLLDTGAFRSILPIGFVRAHNLGAAVHGTWETLVDANGKEVPMTEAPALPVRFEGETAAGHLDFFVNPADGTTKEGLVSPQDLIGKGQVLVIDLERESLRREPEEVALERLHTESPDPLQDLDASRCLLEGFFERSHRIVHAKVNGIDAKMLVDTGAAKTVLSRNNPALASMMKKEGTHELVSATSSEGSALLVRDVQITVAGTPFVLPVLVHPRTMTCAQGVIGADVLSHCTLIWGSSSLWASCRPTHPDGPFP
jgi:gag-polyprotein putative aspartyl protease